MARNGHLSYSADGASNSFDLYVETFNQPLSLAGSSAQTRLHKQFFPKSYAPGNMTVAGKCTSQEELQQLAKFIRGHHVVMVNTRGSTLLSTLATTSAGFNRLMRMSIDGESILYRGWIDNFTITKKGLQDPAPEYSFDFFVTIDMHAREVFASRYIVDLWWNQSGTTANDRADVTPGIVTGG